MNMNPQNKSKMLGILGGLGPMSTVYFYELLTSHTKASSDADHIDLLISSRASTPDRTAFILGKSKDDPFPVMLEEMKRLTSAGAELLVIPCNTAHTFYERLQAKSSVPILNIIEETVLHLKKGGVRTFGLLATEGTVKSNAYPHFCAESGMRCIVPTEEEQQIITSIIYDDIKQNRPVDMKRFHAVADAMRARGCEKLVLGCTELSLLKRNRLSDDEYVDSLEVLAYQTVLACQKTPCGFSEGFLTLEQEEKV